MGEVHLFHDPDASPKEWRVEEIDSDGDGGIDMAIFSGPHAEQRAKRFAERGLRMRPDCEPQPRMSGRLKLELMIGLDGNGAHLL